MANDKPKCGHSTIKSDCNHCKALQKKWYSKLSDEGFKCIEYFSDTVALHDKDPDKPLSQRLYQPVNLDSINSETTDYYDLVWSVYHAWVKERRSIRDCTVAELLAKQDGDTGTTRGISAYLKANKLKPHSKRMVDKTIKEIKTLLKIKK